MKAITRVLTLMLAVIMALGSTALAADVQVAIFAQDDLPLHDWDPAISYSSDHHIFLQVYEQLVRYNANTGEYLNVLCTDYSHTDDGLKWTFKLREDAKFHCGQPFNAAAVKYSIERNKNMQQGASYLWEALEEVKVIDDYTVEFVMSAPVNLLEFCSCQYDSYIYCPTCAGEDLAASSAWFYECNMCGTGPYMLQSYTQNSTVVLTKFEDYWGGWKDNQFDKVVFQTVTETSSRRQMIEGGEADVAINIVPTDAESLALNPNLNVQIVDAAKNVLCFYNTLRAPLDNPTVRKALTYAFPFDDVVDYVKLGKYGSKPLDIVCPHLSSASTESQPYYYDLEKAKELLAEAGYPNGGFEVNVTYNTDNEDTKKMMELWKSELDKIGVTLKIEAGIWEAVYGEAKTGDPQQRQYMFAVETSVDTMSSYSAYASSCFNNGSWNFTGYGNPELDEEFMQAYYDTAIGKEGAVEKLREVEAKYADDCFLMNMCDMKLVIVTKKNLKGFEYNAAYDNTVLFYDCYREDA